MLARVKLKGIDGGPHKRWSMWFNSMIREEPYQGLTCAWQPVRAGFPARDVHTGAAWLSSARVVRCWVKSRNERNPYCLLPAFWMGTRTELPVTNRRKVGMTSSHHGPYVLGYTRATMAGTARYRRNGDVERIAKSRSQFGLESETRLHEGGIACNRASAWRGEYVPGPCTHRPSHHPSWGYPKSLA